MTTKKRISRVFAIVLAIVLTVALAVPAFAAISTSANSQYILGWGGGGSYLTNNGVGKTVSVQSSGTPHQWSVVSAPHGNYRITSNGSDLNVYRVLQGGAYYLCTTYPYENATQGRDQRVNIYTSGSTSQVQLASPIMGGSWYMMTDKSALSSYSDVIWYTYTNASKAQWL